MVNPTRPPRNSFNAVMRKVYNPLGFSNAYNFILWVIFAGALLGFVLARFMYLNFRENFCPYTPSPGGNSAAPGECYYYLNFSRYKVGIILHLAGILPAGLLVVLQFTPVIRHRWILFHRINGHLALLLYLVSVVGALMIARQAFGGGLDTQVAIGVLAITTVGSFVLSYINIKRLQIEQHRAWMLRGWFYAASIITLRIIMIISTMIISKTGGYHYVWPCVKIESTLPDASTLATDYPTCAAYANGTDPSGVGLVKADFSGPSATAATTGAALDTSFGMAMWLALILHAVGVEIYLYLTPKESQRLRQVSYQRQLEAGMRHPGSAGLTADRLGDSDKWIPEDMARKSSATTQQSSLADTAATHEVK